MCKSARVSAALDTSPRRPGKKLRKLESRACRWPRPWRHAILHSITASDFLGTPIAEYVPVRLATGRLALAGNAGHLPTPMTGQGFGASVRDVEALCMHL